MDQHHSFQIPQTFRLLVRLANVAVICLQATSLDLAARENSPSFRHQAAPQEVVPLGPQHF